MSTEVASGSESKFKLTRIQWLICVIATIGFLFDIYELLMLPLIVKPALAELIGTHVVPGSPEWTTWVGRLFYIPAIVGGIFGLMGGWLTDRFGRRRVLTYSILLYAFAAFFAGFSTSPWQLLFFRCLVFIGVCVEFVAAVAWLSELFPDKQLREKVLGYTQAFSSVGGLSVAIVYHWLVNNAEAMPVIPNLIGTIENSQADWRYTLMSGLIPAIPLIIIRPFLPESPQWQKKKDAGQLKRPSFGELFTPELRRTTIVATILFAMAYGAAFGALQQIQRIVPGLGDVQAKATAQLQKMSDGYTDDSGKEILPNPAAMTILANRTTKGIGTKKDPTKAVTLLQTAAGMKHEYQPAQLQLGLLHMKTDGPVDHNPTRAVELIEAAAKIDADAMLKLATMHLAGEHVKKSVPDAELLLVAASNKYHPGAMALLGQLHAEGKTKVPDKAEAYKWLKLASRFKTKNALSAKPDLAKLEKSIDPDDRAKGQAEAKKFTPPQRNSTKEMKDELAVLKKKKAHTGQDKVAIAKNTRKLQIGAAKSTVPRINKASAAKITKVQEVGGMYGRIVMALLIMMLLVHGPAKMFTYMKWTMLAAFLVMEGINGFSGSLAEHLMRAGYGAVIGAILGMPMWLLCKWIGRKFEGTPSTTVLRMFQLPGIIAIPIVFAVIAQSSEEYLYYGVFIAGFLTIGQFTFWGNMLPKLFPVHLRGTGESFAANIGGRLIGTSFAWVTATVSSMTFVPGATPQAKLAYTAAAVGMLVFTVGYFVAGLMPEPKYSDPEEDEESNDEPKTIPAEDEEETTAPEDASL